MLQQQKEENRELNKKIKKNDKQVSIVNTENKGDNVRRTSTLTVRDPSRGQRWNCPWGP